MTDPLAVLGLERGDLLAAAACLHHYRQPHMRALVARLSEAEHRAALQAAAPLAHAEPGSGATQAADWHSAPTQPPNGPQNAETEQ